ncbi:hypothetical protein WR25_21695 [Diploscapter pachys]|uniref:Uncharacterized protein n=1 Tax=Diploscapter pachys TaxID=2018661 RepID=A0A2A2LC11_9BILA|nr:hypothetical protein WR25_21695 [Diploscapter pachys]
MSLRNVCSGVIFLFLLAACLALFILHSLYFILRNADDSQKEDTKMVTEDQVFIPAIIICNKLPFSQDGINSVSGNLRTDQPLRYFREWVDPSIREISDYVSPSQGYFEQGETTVMQYLGSNRNQTISRMQYECQSVINSCSYNGIEMSSFDCCRNVMTHIPTTEGLCWAYHDRTLWQNSTGIMRQFTVTFQMTQNSWYSTLFNQHPGIWVYLKENADDPTRLATELTNPLILTNKHGLRLLVRKERRADTTRGECGQAIGDSRRSDEDAMHDNRTNLLMCNMMVAMKYCGCHPLLAELLHFNPLEFK